MNNETATPKGNPMSKTLTAQPTALPLDPAPVESDLTSTLIRGDAMNPRPDDLIAQTVTRDKSEILARDDGWQVIAMDGFRGRLWGRIVTREALPPFPTYTPRRR